MRSPADRFRKSGFTIVEVLLAVGLTSLLMAGLYASMTSYWNLAVDSHEEIERAQIARALLRQMARDIQSCSFVEQQITDDEEEEASSTDADTAMAAYTNGLIGAVDDLVLYVSRPDRDMNYYSAQDLVNAQDRSSDMMIIRYFKVIAGGNGVSGALAEQTSMIDGTAGLGRMAGDMFGLSNAIQTGNLDRQVQAAALLAPEVSDIQFYYHDGSGTSVTEWDSTALNAMPVAIEIQLTLRTVADPDDLYASVEDEDSLAATVHTLVVPIPVATPYVGESAF